MERKLGEQRLSLADESTLFNAANCLVLLDGYETLPIRSPVSAWWASRSLARPGVAERVELLGRTLDIEASSVIDTDHEHIIEDARLLGEVEARLGKH